MTYKVADLNDANYDVIFPYLYKLFAADYCHLLLWLQAML